LKRKANSSWLEPATTSSKLLPTPLGGIAESHHSS
jgi:hypothetical protein